jgi:large subunit ribosomal protein L25
VVSLSGVLVRGVQELEVETLPADLVPAIDVDLSVLKEINSAIHIRDLVIPPGLHVLTDLDEQVARVTFQTKEEDLSTPAGATPTEVEVIEKGKIEEEGEGEAAAKPEAGAGAKKK